MYNNVTNTNLMIPLSSKCEGVMCIVGKSSKEALPSGGKRRSCGVWLTKIPSVTSSTIKESSGISVKRTGTLGSFTIQDLVCCSATSLQYRTTLCHYLPGKNMILAKLILLIVLHTILLIL